MLTRGNGQQPYSDIPKLFLHLFSKERAKVSTLRLVNDKSLGPAKSTENSPMAHRLVGLVVKASASRAGGPGFESR